MKLNKPIGILGGTFDPIHFAHLRMAIELQDAFNLERIHFIPCYEPVHREKPIGSVSARTDMLKIGINDRSHFVLDEREIKRQGPSYFIDTLLELRQEKPHTPICLLIGLDAFLGFTTWQRYQEIIENGHIIIAHRPEYSLPQNGLLADFLQKYLQNQFDFIHNNLSGGIFLQRTTALEISSSDIRKQIAEGKDASFLLPEPVYDYIKKHHIY